MIEIVLMVLVAILAGVVVGLAMWLNQMAGALNALGQQLQSMQQRPRSDDPAANFKCL